MRNSVARSGGLRRKEGARGGEASGRRKARTQEKQSEEREEERRREGEKEQEGGEARSGTGEAASRAPQVAPEPERIQPALPGRLPEQRPRNSAGCGTLLLPRRGTASGGKGRRDSP